MEIIGLLIVVAVGVVLFLAMRQPDEFRVSRSVDIAAPPAVIFDHINDVEKTQQWSPWVAMDPDADYTFEGPKQGEGAIVRWNGKKCGKGTSTVVEVREPEFQKIRLDFEKPMTGTNHAEFRIEPRGPVCHVTWIMYGPNKFMGKVMGVFMDCEKMCGDQFEAGLVNLKRMCETNTAKAA